MEHKWDEAYGYFGAARDYLRYSDAQLAGKTPAEFSFDSNGDGKIDVVVSNRKGVFLFLQE